MQRRLENIALTFVRFQRELGVCSSSNAHRADSEGVSRYAYGYASKARVVVAYREIEYRGTFYLEEAVASSQGFYCSSRVMQSETKNISSIQ